MTVAVSKAVEDGARAVVCASTGNTSASAAAYAARARIRAVVLVAEGAAAREARPGAGARRAGARRARQLRRGAHGRPRARRARRLRARQLAQPRPRRGPEDGRVRDRRGARRPRPTPSCCPTAGAATRPRTRAGSAELGIDTPMHSVEAADRPRTLASAIRIEQPAHRERVEASGAHVHAVTDEEIVAAWLELAREEGLFCEPASAAGLRLPPRERRAARRPRRRDDHGARAQGPGRRRHARAAAAAGRPRSRRDRASGDG